jgi:hypothetical protein
MQALKEKHIDKTNIPKLSFLYQFFCWCSGARLYLLKQCPSEFNKYYGIGVIVFLTGVMASLSGGYAMFTVFRNLYVSLAFAALWGYLIFSIDWYIVSSLRKHNNKSKEFLMALPRFVLAILIAFVVSMPLKMKLFEREIEQQILFDQQQSILEYQSLVSQEFDDIEKLEKENSKLREEVALKEQQRNSLFSMIIAEAEGQSPTRMLGKGPVYREKKAEYDKVDNELTQLRITNSSLVEQNNKQLQSLRDRREAVLAVAQITNRDADGFLARLQAMSALSAGSRSIFLASWFIILLFITIESAPIIVKLLSERGSYDDLIEAEEYKKQIEIKKDIVQVELTEDYQIDLHQLLEKERNDILFRVEKEHIHEEAKVLSELNVMRIEKWKQEELAKINAQITEYGLNFGNESSLTNIDEPVNVSKTEKLFEPEENPELKEVPFFDDETEEKDINIDKENPNRMN